MGYALDGLTDRVDLFPFASQPAKRHDSSSPRLDAVRIANLLNLL